MKNKKEAAWGVPCVCTDPEVKGKEVQLIVAAVRKGSEEKL